MTHIPFTTALAQTLMSERGGRLVVAWQQFFRELEADVSATANMLTTLTGGGDETTIPDLVARILAAEQTVAALDGVLSAVRDLPPSLTLADLAPPWPMSTADELGLLPLGSVGQAEQLTLAPPEVMLPEAFTLYGDP